MNSNIRFAIILAVLTALWMLSGIFGGDTSEKDLNEETSLFAVEVQNIKVKSYAQPVFIRARTEAEKRVMIAAEIDGQVVAVPMIEGSSVLQGEVLCEIADESRSATLAQAEAALVRAQLDYDGALKLKDGGFQSRSQIAATKAQLKMAEADLRRARMEVDRLSVVAPFSGVLEKQYAEVGSFIQRGQPCAELIALDPIVIVGYVSEDAITKLSVGDNATVTVLGQDVPSSAGVRYVAKAAEAGTQSYRVEVALKNTGHVMTAGQTADVVVVGKPVKAHHVSSSLLTLLDNGEVGLRVVNSDNVVELHRVRLLGDDKEGIWVSGLPEQARLIVVGQEYVSEGQTVNVAEQTEYVSEKRVSEKHSAEEHSSKLNAKEKHSTAQQGSI